MEREEATTTSQQQHNEEGGRGVGGKIKRPIVRKHNNTPYSRTQRNVQSGDSGGGGGGWWLSRLISGGATKLLPSFFSKPADDEEEEQPGDEVDEDASNERLQELHDIPDRRSIESGQVSLEAEGGSHVNVPAGNTLHRSSDGTGISELEQMLKGQTFSRDDLNRLTEILKSRMTIQPDVDERGKRNADATTGGEPFVASWSRENLEGPHVEKREDYMHRVIEESSTPFPKSIPQDLVGASPVDIAKAYMGRRTSGSGVGSQALILKEEATPVPARGFLPKSSVVSPKQKASICWPGAMVHETHPYLTPQSERGRVGIHTARQTPYSRAVHSRSTTKLEGGSERFDNIFSTNSKQLQSPVYGGSQARRTSVSSHYSGFGSVGPIRRPPHRKFLQTMTPSRGTPSHLTTSTPSRDQTFDASKTLIPMAKQNLIPGASTSTSTNPSSNFDFSTLNNQSSDMAKKILEHLDRTIPTPEKKSTELKIATSWRKTQLSSESQQSSRGQKFDQEKEVRGTSLLSDEHVKKKLEETTNAVNTKPSGSSVFSRDIFAGNSGVQFNTEVSTEVKKTPAFEVNTSEVSTKHDERPQPTSEVIPQPISTFTKKPPNNDTPRILPKKAPTHTFGNKPPLTSISITKPPPNSFTFPVSASSNSLLDPPTPSILPSFSPPKTTTRKEVANAPSFSFGGSKTGHPIVFTFPSSSSPSLGGDCDYSKPEFSFGNDKTRLSFKSLGGDGVCL